MDVQELHQFHVWNQFYFLDISLEATLLNLGHRVLHENYFFLLLDIEFLNVVLINTFNVYFYGKMVSSQLVIHKLEFLTPKDQLNNCNLHFLKSLVLNIQVIHKMKKVFLFFLTLHANSKSISVIYPLLSSKISPDPKFLYIRP